MAAYFSIVYIPCFLFTRKALFAFVLICSQVSQSRNRFSPERPQEILPLARLPLCQVYTHRRTAEGHGRTSRTQETAGARRGGGQRSGKPLIEEIINEASAEKGSFSTSCFETKQARQH